VSLERCLLVSVECVDLWKGFVTGYGGIVLGKCLGVRCKGGVCVMYGYVS
jgi:hypothetical protein